MAIVTSSFTIVLTYTFLLRGAAFYIVPSRLMNKPFDVVNFGLQNVLYYFTVICEYWSESVTSFHAKPLYQTLFVVIN